MSIQEAVSLIQAEYGRTPKVGVVLGSGLGAFASTLDERVSIPYTKIPGWPKATAVGHASELVLGKIGQTDVVVMSGRNHFYEGYTAQQVVFGTRVMGKLGIQSLVLTNAAGGVNTSYKPGQLVLISDHINLMGDNPLIGPNDDALGPRFPDMSEPYSRALIALTETVALELCQPLQRGVFIGVPGPKVAGVAVGQL